LGLLLLRVVAGCALILQSVTLLRTGIPPAQLQFLPYIAILTAVLLIGGLWTPITGTLTALIGVARAVLHRADPLASVLVATVGVALALLGPGAWSIDGYLFGWRRVDLKDRGSNPKRGTGSDD